jgi:nitrogen fixation/metabolism regulation signal transduction histidine kinase
MAFPEAPVAATVQPAPVPLTIRLPADRVWAQARQFTADADLCALLDAMPCFVLVLNAHRQIIHANRRVAELLGALGAGALEQFLGVRPGELLDCDHATETQGGCGLSPACSACGAAKAIGACERHAAAVQECRILRKADGRALDLRVTATPLHLGSGEYHVLALTDIGDQKRRQMMERLFYHDLLNLAGGLHMGLEAMADTDAELRATLSAAMRRTAAALIEEVRAQRDLSAAENQTLAVQWEDLSTRALVEDVAGIYRGHELAKQRQVELDGGCQDMTLRSDKRLLTRILGNMVKNALEASKPGQTVTLGCRQADGTAEFWVQNPGVMPRDAQLQVFQRSFSTKGAGRGLGTYSIKLFSEQYLHGKASFTSSPDAGTVFRVRFPAAGGM